MSSAPWKAAAGVWEESVMLPVSIGVGVGKCMGKRRGHVPLGYFLVRLVFVADVTAELSFPGCTLV